MYVPEQGIRNLESEQLGTQKGFFDPAVTLILNGSMTLLYEFDLYILKMYLHREYKVSRSRHSQVGALQRDKQTHREMRLKELPHQKCSRLAYPTVKTIQYESNSSPLKLFAVFSLLLN